MNERYIYRFITLIYLGLIFYISSLAQPVKLPPFPGFDKIIHFFEFGLVGYLVYKSIEGNNNKRTQNYSIFLSIFYGGTDEIHQYFVPGRNCDWADFLVDSLGVIFTVLILSKLKDNS